MHPAYTANSEPRWDTCEGGGASQAKLDTGAGLLLSIRPLHSFLPLESCSCPIFPSSLPCLTPLFYLQHASLNPPFIPTLRHSSSPRRNLRPLPHRSPSPPRAKRASPQLLHLLPSTLSFTPQHRIVIHLAHSRSGAREAARLAPTAPSPRTGTLDGADG